MNFKDLGLSPEVLSAVEDAGYTEPTPIQEKAIPYVLMGRDVLGTAQTGTGKTAGFTLPMIDILASGQAKAMMPRSLIIEPTRELAIQVAENFEKYGKNTKLSMALLIGGVSFSEQDAKLSRGVDVLIATPGRLLDHFERGKVLLNGVKVLVIDEADRMMDMGFIPDVERIVSLMPKIRQTLFFSATMSKEMRRLADQFLMNPKEISVAPPASPAATVTQGLSVVEAMDKREALRRLIRAEDVKNAFIFCNRKRDVDTLYKSLAKHGFNAGALHGDMSQSHRTETLEKFKSGEIQLLVCSDVAARGIDVRGLSHVFNFDLPIHAEDYVHRIGRTGRAGSQGRAFSLATPDDGKFHAAIVELIGREIPLVEIEGFENLPFEAGEGKRRRKRPSQRKGERKPAPARGAERAPAREAAKAPVREAEKAPAREAAKAKPEEARKAPATARQARPAGRREEERGKPVIGFGDYMPAFLMRSVRPAEEAEMEEPKPIKKATTKKAATGKAATKKTAAKKTTARKASAKKAAEKEEAPEEEASGMTSETAIEAAAEPATEAAPETAAETEATAKKAPVKKTAAKKTATKKAAPKKSTAKKSTAKKAGQKAEPPSGEAAEPAPQSPDTEGQES